MDEEGMQFKAAKYTGMDTEFDLEWQKSKDKELTRFFWNKFNVSDFSTRFFSRLITRAYLSTPSSSVLHTHFFKSSEKMKPGWQSLSSKSTECEFISVEYASVNIIFRFFLCVLLYTPSVSRNENGTDSLGKTTNKLSSSTSFCVLLSWSISNAKTLVITSPPSSSMAFRFNGTSSPGETWNRKSYKTFRAQCHLDHLHQNQHQDHHHHQLFTKTGNTLTPQVLNTCIVLGFVGGFRWEFNILNHHHH